MASPASVCGKYATGVGPGDDGRTDTSGTLNVRRSRLVLMCAPMLMEGRPHRTCRLTENARLPVRECGEVSSWSTANKGTEDPA